MDTLVDLGIEILDLYHIEPHQVGRDITMTQRKMSFTLVVCLGVECRWLETAVSLDHKAEKRPDVSGLFVWMMVR